MRDMLLNEQASFDEMDTDAVAFKNEVPLI